MQANANPDRLRMPDAFVVYEPFGPTHFTICQDENHAYRLTEELLRVGKRAEALIGEHTADDLLAAIRRSRAAYVASLAARLADKASA